MNTSTLWQPRSRCDASCLPRPGSGPVAPAWVRVVRLAATAGVLFAAALVVPLTAPPRRGAAARRLARVTLRCLGVRLSVRGRMPAARALVVANHVSWLDVLVLLAVAPVRLLAKRELRGWPLVGWLAGATGTVFVDRARPRALPATVAAVAAVLRSGGVVAAFPEGTTWCGRASGRFRPAVFQAACDAGVPVTPVTLGYRSGGGLSTAAAFVGDATLVGSLWRVLGSADLEVTVDARPPLLPPPAVGRRDLARLAELTVRCGDDLTHLEAAVTMVGVS